MHEHNITRSIVQWHSTAYRHFVYERYAVECHWQT